MFKTFQYRIKDSNLGVRLGKMARSVNLVWNFCNETQRHALKWNKPWPGVYSFSSLTAGCSKELGIQSSTIQAIGEEYFRKRKHAKKSYLRFRSNTKSLPWIPFKADGLKLNRETGKAKYFGLEFNVWYSRHIEGIIKTGSICADSRGRWYLNITCEIAEASTPSNREFYTSAIGIDLGLKSLLTTSNGVSIGNQRYYRKQQKRLAKAQRAGNNRQVQNIHAKIKNQRKDFHHKLSTDLVNQYDIIVIGDIKSLDITKRNKMLSKSVYDAGWYQLKSFLSYKALANRTLCREVSERYSTQTCSCCGVIPYTSPKGAKGLNIREWVCSSCFTLHDRDVNAAKNILRSGCRSILGEGLRIDLRSVGIPIP